VLSAVDSGTARHLFERVLTGPLLKDRTCVLLTHHVGLVLPGASYRVELFDGRVISQGPVKFKLVSPVDLREDPEGSDEIQGAPAEDDVDAREKPVLPAETWATGAAKSAIFHT
jgi:hypothetical protein